MLSRVAIACAISHPLAALAVAGFTHPFPSALGAAALFAVVGFLYLIPEAIFTVGAIRLLHRSRGTIGKSFLSAGIIIAASLIGASLAFKVGDRVPSDYRYGYGLAGALVGIVACSISCLYPIEQNENGA